VTVWAFLRPVLVASAVGLLASTQAVVVQASVLWASHAMGVADVSSSWAGLGGALALVFYFARYPSD
jgi:hypothetical protein